MRTGRHGIVVFVILCVVSFCVAQQAPFHNAPESAASVKNPYAARPAAATAGKNLFAQNCAQCHGKRLQGAGPAPALNTPAIRSAKPGELFWFITNGKPDSGMPAWSNLPKSQRWEIVSFLQSTAAEKTDAK